MRSSLGVLIAYLILDSSGGLELDAILTAASLAEFATPGSVLTAKLDAIQDRRQLTNPYWPEPPEDIANYINFAAVSRRYTTAAFFLTGSQSIKDKEADVYSWGGSKLNCHHQDHFCIPCGIMLNESFTQDDRVAECNATMAQIQSFSCRFGSATTEVPPFVTDCAAWLKDKRWFCIEENGRSSVFEQGNAGFHLHHKMGDTLTLKCPIPPAEQRELQAGSPINVTLVQGGKSYPQRLIYPHEPDTPEVPMAAVLYYNLKYRNNAELLPEWFNYAMIQGISHVYIYTFSDLSNVVDILPKDLASYVESGRATVVHWPSTGFCEDQMHVHAEKATRSAEACSMDVQTQQWAYNHFLLNYGEYSKFTVISDVDEFMSPTYEHGNLLSTMEYLEKSGALAQSPRPYVSATYNIWLKQDSVTPGNDLNIEKFYRYCHDPGIGKGIVWNKRTWSINLHRAEGSQGTGFDPKKKADLTNQFRTHHLRNGKHNGEVFQRDYCRKDRQAGYDSVNAVYFGWMVPCMKTLLRTNATKLPSECTMDAMLKDSNVKTPIAWTP
jgi:hypothetical protein